MEVIPIQQVNRPGDRLVSRRRPLSVRHRHEFIGDNSREARYTSGRTFDPRSHPLIQPAIVNVGRLMAPAKPMRFSCSVANHAYILSGITRTGRPGGLWPPSRNDTWQSHNGMSGNCLASHVHLQQCNGTTESVGQRVGDDRITPCRCYPNPYRNGSSRRRNQLRLHATRAGLARFPLSHIIPNFGNRMDRRHAVRRSLK